MPALDGQLSSILIKGWGCRHPGELAPQAASQPADPSAEAAGTEAAEAAACHRLHLLDRQQPRGPARAALWPVSMECWPGRRCSTTSCSCAGGQPSARRCNALKASCPACRRPAAGAQRVQSPAAGQRSPALEARQGGAATAGPRDEADHPLLAHAAGCPARWHQRRWPCCSHHCSCWPLCCTSTTGALLQPSS